MHAFYSELAISENQKPRTLLDNEGSGVDVSGHVDFDVDRWDGSFDHAATPRTIQSLPSAGRDPLAQP